MAKRKRKRKKHLIWNNFDDRDAGVGLVTFVKTISKVGEVAGDAASGQNKRGVKGLLEVVTHNGVQSLSMRALSL